VACYENCECTCTQPTTSFDEIVRSETRFFTTLRDVAESAIGWFQDRTLGEDNFLREWGLNDSGVYVIWHKDAYCAEHERFHMRALYVGKGDFYGRLNAHWKNKDFSTELLLYFTMLRLPNRQAKYVEQLLLDLYEFPYNVAENPGTARLCWFLTQDQVD